jgi:hypothetical protein
MTAGPSGDNVLPFPLTEADGDIGAKTGHWTELIRRARLPDGIKKTALIIATYANADGTGIWCGIPRLSVDCECSYRTAQRHLTTLRTAGLIQVTKRGNRRRGHSDEYRLTFGPHVLDYLPVLTPDEYEARIDAARAANRATTQQHYKRSRQAVDNPLSDVQPSDVRTTPPTPTSDVTQQWRLERVSQDKPATYLTPSLVASHLPVHLPPQTHLP